MDNKILRRQYLDYFRTKNHVIIPGASLIPEHDPSVLFTTAGMHPLVPFLMGQPHPAGKRLADCQKCLRTDDIVEVGDDIHLTFFEMLGNWSLGDYWKKEAIQMSLEFLTDKLGLEIERLYVSCFAGDKDAPKDLEAYETWLSLGIPPNHILFLPKKDNWWGPVGARGPCGPDTEIFYDMHPGGPGSQNIKTNPNRFWEVWNDVFMQYEKLPDGSYLPIKQKNVDTGLGLERVLAILEGVDSIYETELFLPIIDKIRTLAKNPDQFALRVVADHLRAVVFILAEGIIPANNDQPYIARRLIRRAVRYGRELGIEEVFLGSIAETAISTLSDVYPELRINREHILTALENEEVQFQKTIQKGEKEFSKLINISGSRVKILSGADVFRLYDTYGFPPELTQELAAKEGITADMDGYRMCYAKHQEKSREGGASRFKGGLADHSEEATRLHTATHLLHAALRKVLSTQVEQKGSNITVQRLRFDFSYSRALRGDELEKIERLVNRQIERDLPVGSAEMSLEKAKLSGAIGLFEERYGDTVRVYSIGDFSKEICGGPHATHTGALGRFRIIKEEAVGMGIRRIRAILEVNRRVLKK
jgi:alanyl-tRNA synthetase